MPSKYTPKGYYTTWRDDEEEIIYEFYSIEPSVDVTDRINDINIDGQPKRTVDAVKRRASILGVPSMRTLASKNKTLGQNQHAKYEKQVITKQPQHWNDCQRMAVCGRWV